MKVMVIPMVIGALATVLIGLVRRLEELEIGGRGGTIQSTNGQNIEKSPGCYIAMWNVHRMFITHI